MMQTGLKANKKKKSTGPDSPIYCNLSFLISHFGSGYDPDILYSSLLYLILSRKIWQLKSIMMSKGGWQYKMYPTELMPPHMLNLQQKYHKNYKNCKLTTDF